MRFTEQDFYEIQGPSAANLLKIAASNAIGKLGGNPDRAKQLSIKYQVLCDETAIIGVMKQKNQSTGELKESTIKFTKGDQSGFDTNRREPAY